MSAYNDLLQHLESVAWRLDAKGEPECFDQGAAMAAEAIRKLETELTAALQREKELELKLDISETNFIGAREALIREGKRAERAEAELSRYREAEKALPVEPEYCDADGYILQSNNQKPVFVKKTAYDALRAYAAALQAKCGAMQEDSERLDALENLLFQRKWMPPIGKGFIYLTPQPERKNND